MVSCSEEESVAPRQSSDIRSRFSNRMKYSGRRGVLKNRQWTFQSQNLPDKCRIRVPTKQYPCSNEIAECKLAVQDANFSMFQIFLTNGCCLNRCGLASVCAAGAREFNETIPIRWRVRNVLVQKYHGRVMSYVCKSEVWIHVDEGGVS
jgi:hypothetical protein